MFGSWFAMPTKKIAVESDVAVLIGCSQLSGGGKHARKESRRGVCVEEEWDTAEIAGKRGAVSAGCSELREASELALGKISEKERAARLVTEEAVNSEMMKERKRSVVAKGAAVGMERVVVGEEPFGKDALKGCTEKKDHTGATDVVKDGVETNMRVEDEEKEDGLDGCRKWIALEEEFPCSSPVAAVEYMTQFLADVEQEVASLLCRLLPHMTNSPSSCFLSVGKLGRSPRTRRRPLPFFHGDTKSVLRSSIFSDELNQGNHPERSKKWTEDGDGEEEEEEQLLRRRLEDEHYNVFKRLRGTIVSASTLHHRACQVLWGPVGSGKSRLLRAIAAETRQRPHTLVFYLDGASLRSEMAAVRRMADQLLHFLLSPTSATVRAADWSIRTGSFGLGKLFHFPQRLRAARRKRGRCEKRHDRMKENSKAGGIGKRHGTVDREEGMERKNRHANLEEEDEQEEEESSSTSEEEDEDMHNAEDKNTLESSAAVNALVYLDAALHLFREHHVNILICIRQAEQFCVWCDHLLYVLAGLLHDAGDYGNTSSTTVVEPGGTRAMGTRKTTVSSTKKEVPFSSSSFRGGGLIFLFTSNGPDLKHLEKRLSSRLTPEARHVPLLPWTPRCLIRAALCLVKELHACRALMGAAIAPTVTAALHYHPADPPTLQERSNWCTNHESVKNKDTTIDASEIESTEDSPNEVVEEEELPFVMEEVACRLQKLRPFFPSCILYGRAKTRAIGRGALSTWKEVRSPPTFSPGFSSSFAPPEMNAVFLPSTKNATPFYPLSSTSRRHNRTREHTAPTDAVDTPFSCERRTSTTTTRTVGPEGKRVFCNGLYSHPTLVSEWVVHVCEAALQELEEDEYMTSEKENDSCTTRADAAGEPLTKRNHIEEEMGAPPLPGTAPSSPSTSVTLPPTNMGKSGHPSFFSSMDSSPALVSLLRSSKAQRRCTNTIGEPGEKKNEEESHEQERGSVVLEEAFATDMSPDVAITLVASLLRQVYTGSVSLLRSSSRQRLMQAMCSSSSASHGSSFSSLSLLPARSFASRVPSTFHKAGKTRVPQTMKSFSVCTPSPRMEQEKAPKWSSDLYPPPYPYPFYYYYHYYKGDAFFCHRKEHHLPRDTNLVFRASPWVWRVSLPPPPPLVRFYVLLHSKGESSAVSLEQRGQHRTTLTCSRQSAVMRKSERGTEGVRECGAPTTTPHTLDLTEECHTAVRHFLDLVTSTGMSGLSGTSDTFPHPTPFDVSSLAKEDMDLSYFVAGTLPPLPLSHSSWRSEGNSIIHDCPSACVGSEVIDGAATTTRLQQWGCSALECGLLSHLLSFTSPSISSDSLQPSDEGELVSKKNIPTAPIPSSSSSSSSPFLSTPPSPSGTSMPSPASSPFKSWNSSESLLQAYDVVLEGGEWVRSGFASRETFWILCTLTLLDPAITSGPVTRRDHSSLAVGNHRPTRSGVHTSASTLAGWRTVEDTLRDVDRLSSICRLGGGGAITSPSLSNSTAPMDSMGKISSYSKPNNYHTSVFRSALEQLHRWGILSMTAGGEQLRLKGDATRWKDMVRIVLTQHTTWCEQILGMDSQEILRFQSLLDR